MIFLSFFVDNKQATPRLPTQTHLITSFLIAIDNNDDNIKAMNKYLFYLAAQFVHYLDLSM